MTCVWLLLLIHLSRRSKSPRAFLKNHFLELQRSIWTSIIKPTLSLQLRTKLYKLQNCHRDTLLLRSKSKVALRILWFLWNGGDCHAFFFFFFFFNLLFFQDAALKMFNFCLFPCLIRNRKSWTFFLSSLPSFPRFNLSPIGFFMFEEIPILTQKGITQYGWCPWKEMKVL